MIGILGGTFDPVHNGHLRLAIEFFERLNLEQLKLIPLHLPPHRDPPVANPEQRLAMLQLALENTEGIFIDECELRKDKTSYTIETITLVKNEIGDVPVCLLMGMDAFVKIHTWYRWNELLDLVHIAIADRPGNNINEYDQAVAELIKTHLTGHLSDLHETTAGKIIKLTVPMLDISATQIRNIIASDRSARGLLPDTVIAYINSKNLYKTDR